MARAQKEVAAVEVDESETSTGFGEDSLPDPSTFSTTFTCPECGRDFTTERGLKRHTYVHRRRVDDEPVSGSFELEILPDGRTKFKAPNAHLQRVGDSFIANVSTVGTIAVMALPHTGLTILSRAPLMGKGVMEIAAKNESVMAGVIRFNQFFTGGELATAAAGVIAAVAVDVGPLDAHGRVAGLLIGDVVAQVDEMREQQAAQEERNGRVGKRSTNQVE